MNTEKELDTKYAEGTPWYHKDPVEWYLCERHGEPTIYVRDADVVVHANSETECR